MKEKILTCLKCIGIFLIFSLPIKIIAAIVSGLLSTACMCYDIEFQQKMIIFIGLILGDLIGVLVSIKIVSKKTNLSNNKLILPFYLITIFLMHPALKDSSYFQLFNYSLPKDFNYSTFYYHSELEKFIINNFELVKNITFIFFILTSILIYSLIIFIIYKKIKKK